MESGDLRRESLSGLGDTSTRPVLEHRPACVEERLDLLGREIGVHLRGGQASGEQDLVSEGTTDAADGACIGEGSLERVATGEERVGELGERGIGDLDPAGRS
jgi:hypothetical protein